MVGALNSVQNNVTPFIWKLHEKKHGKDKHNKCNTQRKHNDREKHSDWGKCSEWKKHNDFKNVEMIKLGDFHVYVLFSQLIHVMGDRTRPRN